MSVPMHTPIIYTDGGPWAEHSMPCAVCSERKAVLDIADGRFHPCWSCQRAGWQLTRKRAVTRLRTLVAWLRGSRRVPGGRPAGGPANGPRCCP